MSMIPFSRVRLASCAAAALMALGVPAMAETIFTRPLIDFAGDVGISGPERSAIHQGGTAVITAEDMIPGQTVTLMRGTTVLNPAPITVDDKGSFSFTLPIDAEASLGLQPIVVIAENPAAAKVVELRISPDLPLQGAEKFDLTSASAAPGLYQIVANAAGDAVFVTSAVGWPPVRESRLLKIDPATLKVLAEVAPAPAPAMPKGGDGGVYAFYGVAVDNAHGRVWVSNTRQDTVAVYDQSDLKLIKQFEPGTVPHARDIVIDETNGRAYASATGTSGIMVFDTDTLEQLDTIKIASQVRNEDFSSMALDLDEAGGKLVTVSLTTPEAALIDLTSGKVRIIPLSGAKAASGVAYDPQEGLIFVASQATDNLLIVKAETGEVLHDVPVGAGPLNVAFDPVGRLAYVANRVSGTIAVVDTKGQLVANLDAGSFPNQLRADGKGNVWAVNKSRGENDEAGDRIWRITPKR